MKRASGFPTAVVGPAAASLILLAALTAGCGTQTEGQTSTTSSSKRTGYQNLNDPAVPPASADAVAANPVAAGAAAGGEPLDCSGITLHEGHDSCDKDDVDAAAGVGSAKPAENATIADAAKSAAAPATPAPAATPATSTTPVTPTTPATPAKDPKIVEFHIKAGTGAGSWNAQANTVTAKVGQTVRVFNDDTVVHRLHTNGLPCPHGPNIPVGTSFDCVVTKAFDPGTTPLYDHIAGTTAQFWLKTTL